MQESAFLRKGSGGVPKTTVFETVLKRGCSYLVVSHNQTLSGFVLSPFSREKISCRRRLLRVSLPVVKALAQNNEH
jgi:hypothetical protein